MKKLAAVMTGAALTLMTASAMATTLDPSLTRQVPIGPTYVGEGSLQSELDKMFGAGKVDATKDQLNVGMFHVTTPGSTGIMPQFKFEWTGNAATQEVGIFGWNGTNAVEAIIFDGARVVGDYATIGWSPDQNSGMISRFNASHVYLGQSSFTGIDRDFFGFFFQPTGSGATYYSVDALNPDGTVHEGGEARVLAYDGGRDNGGILFTYEDGTDFDYQDGGFFVESIAPVPEPGTMMLLGAGFLGLAIYGKRRKNA